MNAKELYKSLYSKGSLKLNKSLETIKKVCDDLEERGIKIYQTKVGKDCFEKYGSPKVTSIRNNKDLSQYIRLRGSEQNINVIPLQNRESVESEILLSYKRENACLRKILKSLSVFL